MPAHSFFSKIKHSFELIKFSHSIFALPFALGSLLIASPAWPSFKMWMAIILAMVFARSSAMAFNRLIDLKFDALNPRTATRPISAGLLSVRWVSLFTLLCSLAFIVTSYFFNALCFYLSPLVLGILFFYSYTKRFTHMAQLVLGFCLSMAPLASWLAVRAELNIIPIVLSIAVLFWVAGFDTLYAMQDFEFDQKHQLHSLVVYFGIKKSFWVARIFHFISYICFILFGHLANLGWIYFIALVVMGLFFLRQHLLLKNENLDAINAAFFTSNGIISFIFLVSILLEKEFRAVYL